jgi:group I intron endonuclease
MPCTPCVYEIRNMLNGRHYIGSSITPQNRKRRHFYDLRHSYHRSKFMQRDFDKCGESSFVFSILESTTAKDILSREQYWIDSTAPVYNSAKIAGNTLGVKQSAITIEKNKLRNTGFGNGNAKINECTAIEIAALSKIMTTAALGVRFNVHKSTIERILARIGCEKKGVRVVSSDVREMQRQHALKTMIPARRIPVIKTDGHGLVIEEFASLADAAAHANVTIATMSEAITRGYNCRGSRYAKRDAAMLVFGRKMGAAGSVVAK